MNEEQKYLDFEAYERVTELHMRERFSTWSTAIGLQYANGLRVSEYLKESVVKCIEGDYILYWKPSKIEQVIISKLSKSIQEIISVKIRKGFALKAESKQLLDEAKIMVKREIEKGGNQ